MPSLLDPSVAADLLANGLSPRRAQKSLGHESRVNTRSAAQQMGAPGVPSQWRTCQLALPRLQLLTTFGLGNKEGDNLNCA